MKIALCISGHLRQYDKCIKSLYDSIIYRYKTDNYISIWNNIDVSDQRIISTEFIKHLTNLYKGCVLVSDFNSIYSLCKNLCNDLNKVNTAYKVSDFMCCDYLMSTFIKNKNFRLDDYDFIIKCRPDIIVNKFEINFNLLDSNTIYIGSLDKYQVGGLNKEQGSRAFNPSLIVGDKKSIFKYMEIVDDYCNIPEYLEYSQGLDIEFLNPHLFPSNFLMSHDIKLKHLENINSQIYKLPNNISHPVINNAPMRCKKCGRVH